MALACAYPVQCPFAMSAGGSWLVFPSRRGSPMQLNNLRHSWSVIRQAAGPGPTRVHDLRHTCVTLLMDLGASPHVVREIAGHSDIEVTMTIHAHVSLEEKRKGARQTRGSAWLMLLLSNGPALRASTGVRAAQRWRSGAGSNRRPSAFQVNDAKRCANLRKRMSPASGTALGGRCRIDASRLSLRPVHPATSVSGSSAAC